MIDPTVVATLPLTLRYRLRTGPEGRYSWDDVLIIGRNTDGMCIGFMIGAPQTGFCALDPATLFTESEYLNSL